MEEEKENHQLRKEVITKGQQLEDRYSGTNKIAVVFASLGICCQCSSLAAVVTKYGTKIAKCQEFNLKLSENNSVDICTGFWKRGHSDIKDLIGMATLIDIKRKVGFGQGDEYL